MAAEPLDFLPHIPPIKDFERLEGYGGLTYLCVVYRALVVLKSGPQSPFVPKTP